MSEISMVLFRSTGMPMNFCLKAADDVTAAIEDAEISYLPGLLAPLAPGHLGAPVGLWCSPETANQWEHHGRLYRVLGNSTTERPET